MHIPVVGPYLIEKYVMHIQKIRDSSALNMGRVMSNTGHLYKYYVTHTQAIRDNYTSEMYGYTSDMGHLDKYYGISHKIWGITY